MAASIVIPSATDILLPASIRGKSDGTTISQSLKLNVQAPRTPPPSDDESVGVEETVDVAVSDMKTSATERLVYERKMGDSEQSYFLPSRADGVNDMYLHLGLRAPTSLLAPERVRTVLALLRLRHPLLAARVRVPDGLTPVETDYSDVSFVYEAPRTIDEALEDADGALEYKNVGKDELIDSYLNGPRTLSNERLSYLIVSSRDADYTLPTPAGTPNPDASSSSISEYGEIKEFDLLICAMHFLGDGMALHRFANDFFTLIAGANPSDAASHDGQFTPRTLSDLAALLEAEFTAKWGDMKGAKNLVEVLPAALEDKLPKVEGRMRRAAGRVDFKCSQEKLIGGHAFPRAKSAVRHTIVPTIPIDSAKTKLALRRCKENGVSIANALFALCGIAWSRLAAEKGDDEKRDLPLMMYSALNLRPYLLPTVGTETDSYWFLAVGYFNVVLPSFLLSSSESDSKVKSDIHRTFWQRARSAKRQSTAAAKHPLLVSRTREMALERGTRARTWAREDDEKALGIVSPKLAPAAAPPSSEPTSRPKLPSTALLGLSLLGNLDGMYHHASFPALTLHTLTTGSRQRAGGMLLFGYTFAGKLWLSLGYDEEGFERETVRKWWEGVLKGVDEFLLD